MDCEGCQGSRGFHGLPYGSIFEEQPSILQILSFIGVSLAAVPRNDEYSVQATRAYRT